MIEKTQCRNCNQAYELTWNDVDVDDWRDDFDDAVDFDDDDDDDDDVEEDADPVYCPFCGCHCDYSE
jgi:hypothetical protein